MSGIQYNSNKVRLLLVGGDYLVSKPAISTLEDRGIEVYKSYDRANTLEILEEHDYDVLALDVEGFNNDGFELIHYIHEEKPDLPVILLAHNHSAVKDIAAIRKDIYDYFLEPYNVDYLSLRIKEADVDHLLRNYLHQGLITEQSEN